MGLRRGDRVCVNYLLSSSSFLFIVCPLKFSGTVFKMAIYLSDT